MEPTSPALLVASLPLYYWETPTWPRKHYFVGKSEKLGGIGSQINNGVIMEKKMVYVSNG